jgi:membrane-associated phospholipid phosphatase
MTTMPPPKQSFHGLKALENTSDPLGDSLRDSWSDSFALPLIAPGAVSTPVPPSALDPALQHIDSTAKWSRAFADLMPRVTAVEDAKTRAWSVQGNGTAFGAAVSPPDPAALTQAMDRLRRQAWRSTGGIAGQRDWIPIYFAKALGLNTGSHGRILDLLDIALGVTMIPVFRIKNSANVLRPWQLDPNVRPRIPHLWHSSFPSGHAAGAHVCAAMLIGLANPGAADRVRLHALAQVIAKNRELANVHTDLDSDAGREVGQAVGQWLLSAALTAGGPYAVWPSLYEYARQELFPPP